MMDNLKAVKMTGWTLTVTNQCFSVRTECGFEFSIVNFYKDVLDKIVDKGIAQWPFEIKPLSNRVAIIDDIRIPECLYAAGYCRVCCPFDLLPSNQKDKVLREERAREYYKNKLKPEWDLNDFKTYAEQIIHQNDKLKEAVALTAKLPASRVLAMIGDTSRIYNDKQIRDISSEVEIAIDAAREAIKIEPKKK